MPEHPQFTPQSLTRYTESLRRELYDAVRLDTRGLWLRCPGWKNQGRKP
jgi:hypothetical protein